MNSKIKNWIFAILVTIIVIILFLLSSYFTKTYSAQLKGFLEYNYFLGIIIYLILGIIDAIGVPISNIPIIPVVITLYGFYLGTLLTIAGWFIGSLFAFFIARKYGKAIVEKFISLDKIESMQRYLPKRGLFISMIFFRIFLPHDFVNYGYGIFTDIKKRPFILSSLIGIVLSSLLYSYVETLSLLTQVIIIMAGIIIFIIVAYSYHQITKRN